VRVFVPDVPFHHSGHVPYSFSRQELDALFAAADSLASLRRDGKKAAIQLAACLRVLHGCGLRSGEALELKVGDIGFANGVVAQKGKKTGLPRCTPQWRKF